MICLIINFSLNFFITSRAKRFVKFHTVLRQKDSITVWKTINFNLKSRGIKFFIIPLLTKWILVLLVKLIVTQTIKNLSRILCITKAHCRVHKNQKLYLIFCLSNPSYFHKIPLLSSWVSKGISSFKLLSQNLYTFLISTLELYVPTILFFWPP